ncbi:hypothetical protein GCM10007890_26780 [Methylobacterium tardum]|uniref:Uncharacterized protein n=1 Tax=Methylobacterium tardum TaxID=374432 RepID=A0AA37TEZ4_9HYPH|nr:hypothetical protein GCM10007890_26780 [Methylobacterium tardum]
MARAERSSVSRRRTWDGRWGGKPSSMVLGCNAGTRHIPEADAKKSGGGLTHPLPQGTTACGQPDTACNTCEFAHLNQCPEPIGVLKQFRLSQSQTLNSGAPIFATRRASFAR